MHGFLGYLSKQGVGYVAARCQVAYYVRRSQHKEVKYSRDIRGVNYGKPKVE